MRCGYNYMIMMHKRTWRYITIIYRQSLRPRCAAVYCTFCRPQISFLDVFLGRCHQRVSEWYYMYLWCTHPLAMRQHHDDLSRRRRRVSLYRQSITRQTNVLRCSEFSLAKIAANEVDENITRRRRVLLCKRRQCTTVITCHIIILYYYTSVYNSTGETTFSKRRFHSIQSGGCHMCLEE